MSELDRGITRGHLYALVINCVVGSGVLGLPAPLYRTLGLYSLPAWGLAAVVVALITACFAEVGSRFTETGGAALYAREAFGGAAGFLTGWLSLATRILAFASVSNLLVTHTTPFLPAVAGGAGRAALICAVTLSWCLLLAVGVRHTARVGSALTAVKVALLLGVGLAGALSAGMLDLPPPGAIPSASDATSAALLMMFAFAGFEAATVPGGEMKDPRRDLPVTLALALMTVASLYALVQYACIITLPDLASSERPVVAVAERLFGPSAARATLAVTIAMLAGTLLTQLLSTSRLLYALASSGDLPGRLASLDERFRTPIVAIFVTGACAALAAVGSSFLTAVTITVTTRVITYGVVSASLVALRRRGDVPEPAFRLPMGEAIAAVSLLCSLGLLWAASSQDLAMTALVALAGAVVYAATKR